MQAINKSLRRLNAQHIPIRSRVRFEGTCSGSPCCTVVYQSTYESSQLHFYDDYVIKVQLILYDVVSVVR